MVYLCYLEKPFCVKHDVIIHHSIAIKKLTQTQNFLLNFIQTMC